MKPGFGKLITIASAAAFFFAACSSPAIEEPHAAAEELELFKNGTGTLAFAAQIESGNAYDIFMLDLPGGDVTRITEDPSADISPALHPGGDWLIFSSDRGGTYDLYKMPLPAGDLQPLTTIAADRHQRVRS